jgi:hypothetical protein
MLKVSIRNAKSIGRLGVLISKELDPKIERKIPSTVINVLHKEIVDSKRVLRTIPFSSSFPI